MEPDTKVRRWNSNEADTLRKIVSSIRNESDAMKMGNSKSPFWKKVSDELKARDINRQPSAACAKYHRILRGYNSRRSKGVSSSIYDISDSDGADDIEGEDEDNEECEDDDEDENAVNIIPSYWNAEIEEGYNGDPSKSWLQGSNWSEEEDAIAFECIKGQRDREREEKIEPISADKLWRMVSDSLASHGFYRKHLNVARYWATKGKDKHNLDARTPTAIGRALSETSRTSKMTVKLPWTPGKPSRQSPEQGDSNTGTILGETQLPVLSIQQYDALMAQYSKYNHLDNPVINKLEKETGLNREQIKVWYKNKRFQDTEEENRREADDLSRKEPLAEPFLVISELRGKGLKRHSLSGSEFRSQIVEENPAKKARHSLDPENLMVDQKINCDLKDQEASRHQSMAPGLSVHTGSHPVLPSIQVQQPFFKPAAQIDIQDQQVQLKVALTAERETVRQKILRSEKQHGQLKLVIAAYKKKAAEDQDQLKLLIAAHKEKAAVNLKSLKAKEQELTIQEESQRKLRRRIENIDSILSDD